MPSTRHVSVLPVDGADPAALTRNSDAHCSATEQLPDQTCGLGLIPFMAWEPSFDAMPLEQEQLAIKFCEEIGARNGNSSLLDPVRLLEMAEALYAAERDAQKPRLSRRLRG